MKANAIRPQAADIAAAAADQRAFRDQEIDAGRFFAALAVVVIHALPSETVGGAWVGPVDLATRFAVPFFFIASGFFLGAAAAPGGTAAAIVKLAKRLLPPYAAWLTLYLVATGRLNGWLLEPGALWNTIVYGGPAFHLWFLPFLGASGALALVVNRLIGPMAVLILGAAIAVVALARGPYHAVWTDWPDVSVEPRIAASFVLLGFAAARYGVGIGLRTAVALIALGFAMQLLESDALRRTGQAFGSQHFLAGTYAYGFGVFFALKAIKTSSTFMRVAAAAGRASLGIYCCHLLYVWGARSVFPAPDVVQTSLVFAAASVAATATALTLARFRPLRPLVR